MRFSYDLVQRACSEFTDVPSGIRLSLMIHYVYKPNAHGDVNEHFQTLDYGVDVETTDNFTKPNYTPPSSGTVTIGNTIYTKDTTIYADSIVLNGNISTTNGATVRIISTKPINQIGGSISPNISYYQGTIYPASTIIPLDETTVKSFCSSSDYKAKAYPYSNKMASNTNNPSLSKKDFTTTFTLQPNPASSYTSLVVKNPVSDRAVVKVYDMIGREVYSRDMLELDKGKTSLEISTQELHRGIYIVKIVHGELE